MQAGVTDDEAQLRPCQPEVERHEYGIELRRREQREEEPRMVEPEEADPIAGVHSQCVKPMRHLVGQVVELAVRPLFVAEDERDAVRAELGTPAERETETLVISHSWNPPNARFASRDSPIRGRGAFSLRGPSSVDDEDGAGHKGRSV